MRLGSNCQNGATASQNVFHEKSANMSARIQTVVLAALAGSLLAFNLPGADAAATLNPNSMVEWNFQHDEQGRLKLLRDPGGKETVLEYEMHPTEPQLPKTVRRRFDGGVVVYEFDRLGRIVQMTDTLGTVDYGYDVRGGLNRVQRRGSHAITCTHDSLDRISSVQVGDFYRVDYTYDFLGRLSAMNTPAGKVTYEYQTGSGQVIRSLPNGVKTFWKRQPNGQLEEITHGFFKRPNDKEYSLLAQYTYQHGPDGRITAIRERSPQGDFTKHYTYDNMGRLVRAMGPGGKIYAYTYDAVGNRTGATATGEADQTCAFDWAGRLTSVDGQPCEYDPSGNLTDLTLDGVARQYRYHPDGRLAEVRLGDETVQYGYDGFGHLVDRKTSAGKTRFIPDPLSPLWQPVLVEDIDGGRQLIIWDGQTPLAIVMGSQVEWMLSDHAGSVRLATDANGTV